MQTELKEVIEAREKLYQAFNNIKFNEELHQYHVIEDGESVEYTPVSTVIHNFFKPFNTEEVAERYAIKNNLLKEDVLRNWKYTNLCSTVSGTRTHLYGEGYTWLKCNQIDKIPNECKTQFIKDENWLIPTAPKEQSIKQFYDDLPNSIYPVGAEFKMSSQYIPNINTKMCGTADLLFYYKHPNDDTKSGFIIGDWKGIDIKTPILTTNGWKTMGTLTIDDKVFDCNGEITNILHLSEEHHKPCFKIIFDNKEEIIADEEHRWLITLKNNKDTILTTTELYELISNLSNHPLRIKIAKPIQQVTNEELIVHPYVLGLWLSDYQKDKNKLNIVDDDIINKIIELGYDAKKINDTNFIEIIGLSDNIQNLNITKKQDIPSRYLLSSIENRKLILQGIMDNNGYVNKQGKICCSTMDKNLVNVVKILLSNLGIKYHVTKNDFFMTYIISFECDFNPFLIKKIKVPNKISTRNKFLYIKAIERVETITTRCMEVESKTHTFLFGDKLIVTHNTNKDLYSNYNRKNSIMMLPPFDFLVDENLSHYSLQFGCYELMMRSVGLNIIGRRLIWLKDDGYEVIKIDDRTELLKQIL